MSKKLTNIEVSEFLRDFKSNSTIELLESKKSKTLEKIAETRGIKLEGSTDLAGFKIKYAFAEKANKNGAILAKKPLLKSLPSMIGKPVDIDHDRGYVVGHFIDYSYQHEDDSVIATGVFYKSNFGKEWEKAKRLFKSGNLKTSYEVWCPQDKRTNNEDGTYTLEEIEIAGGAILFDTEPAFEDADVLEIAKKNIEEMNKDLVFANVDKKEYITSSTTIEAKKVICKNCGAENSNFFDKQFTCIECKSIIDEEGTVIYPAQKIDFKLNCACGARDWIVLNDRELSADIKCKQCENNFEISFKVEKDEMKKFSLIYAKNITCPQCNKLIEVIGSANINSHGISCSNCGLEFVHNKSIKKKRVISKVVAKGDKNMKKEEKVEAQVEEASEEVTEEAIDVLQETQEEVTEEIQEETTEEVVEDVQEGAVEENAEAVEEVVEESETSNDETVSETVVEAEETETETQEEVTEEVVESEAVLSMREEIKELKTAKELLESNMDKLVERRIKLGETELSNEDILDEAKYGSALLQKENAALKQKIASLTGTELEEASVEEVDSVTPADIVEAKITEEKPHAANREKVNKIAFPENY